MPPKLTCECGSCKRCKHRVYMRGYYQRRIVTMREQGRSRYLYSNGGVVECRCEWCENAFTTTARKKEGHGVLFCSRACKEAARQAAGRIAREQNKPERECLHCGMEMPRTMRSDAAYCSEQCNSAAHNLKRGNGRLGPGRRRDIERAYIIERDDSRCHICGGKCRPDEITLDHLVPLSKGGTHAPENLRVAHLSCNCAKRDRAANDQLMLIG